MMVVMIETCSCF